MNDEGLQERIAQLEQRVRSLASASSTTALDDQSEAMRLVLDELRKVVPFDSASIQQLRDTRLVIVGGVGFAHLDVILGESFDVDNADTPNGEVIHRRRGMIVADTEQYRAFRRGLHVGAGIRSWLGVPLLFGEQLVGMIALDKQEPNFYTMDHLRIAEAFATVVAHAVKATDA